MSTCSSNSDNTAKTFYITTPIYYVSGKPHIGSAYTTIAADVLARYHRLRGERVLFATGTDEHGQKVLRGAAQAGKSPQDFADSLVAEYRRAWERLHIGYDRFIRTTEAVHVTVVQRVFQRLLAQDDIYLSDYTGWYCVPCETYFLEADLQDGNCPDCGRPAEQVSEQAYFFRSSKYADRLLHYIEEHEHFLSPDSRRNEVLAFIRSGLQDACVSRSRTDWDIPVPDDSDQSIYVWLDALTNYLTVAGYTEDEGSFESIWPPDVQLMGKDILTRFHATLWPAMLMALDVPLPERIFAHGWWNDDSGVKMSKSKANVIDSFEVIDALVEHSGVRTSFAVDTLRYHLLREVPFGLDGSFSVTSLLSRFNADLANDLGNLLNRSLPLVERYVEGRVPDSGPACGALADEVNTAVQTAEERLDQVDFRGALSAIWELVKRCNKFIDEREPWKLHKQGKRVELDAVLYDILDCIRIVAILIDPYMPKVAEEIWDQLGMENAAVERRWADARLGRLTSGVVINRGAPIFPRIDLDRVKMSHEADNSRTARRVVAPATELTAQSEKADQMDMISFDEFNRLDLRIGKVLKAQRVPDTDKLLVLQIDVGEAELRQVVAGLAEQFNPRQLLGKTVVVVANLKPATIAGQKSEGMILAAGDARPLALITTDAEVEPGEKVR